MFNSIFSPKYLLIGLFTATMLVNEGHGLVKATSADPTLATITESSEKNQTQNKQIPFKVFQIYNREIAQSGPTYEPITTDSNNSQIALAGYLRQKKIRFYGAWWCPHCHEQKQLFGKQAFQLIRYVECADRDRPKQQKTACANLSIRAYPTWRINGKSFEGVQSLEDLATLSGYRGSRNFPKPQEGI
jgi:glutaredoxin